MDWGRGFRLQCGEVRAEEEKEQRRRTNMDDQFTTLSTAVGWQRGEEVLAGSDSNKQQEKLSSALVHPSMLVSKLNKNKQIVVI